jgi:biopolymer transport protein ExbD
MAGGGGAPTEEAGPRRNVFGEAVPGVVDLNLTALMDILSNLLFFLLASFGATIVMTINVSVPVQTEGKSDVAEGADAVTVNLKLTKETVEVSAAGEGHTDAELAALHGIVPNVAGKPDFPSVTERLAQIKKGFPKSDTAILTPDPGLPYEWIVRLMDAARETTAHAALFPTVVVSTVVK